MNRGLFICGTDTEVGKTVVSAALLGLLRRWGRPAAWLKPLGSGAVDTPRGPASPDAVFVAEMNRLPDDPTGLCPVLARAPLAPAEALALEGRRLDFDGLVRDCQARLERQEFTVVEGVGGLLVPIDEDRHLGHLMVALGLPVLLVGRPGLGTINHTLLVLRELDRLGLDTIGFVFSGPGQAEAAAANAGWITRFSGARYRGWLGDVGGLDWPAALDLAGQCLDLGGLPGFSGPIGGRGEEGR